MSLKIQLTLMRNSMLSLFIYGFLLINLTVLDLFHQIKMKMQMPTMMIRRWLMALTLCPIQRWLTALTLCPSCIHLVRILYLLIFIEVFLPSRALQHFILFLVMFLNAKKSLLSSRLCEVKAFTGSVDSLRTPFKESCDNMLKSEIG
jgi:hypothetical protein